VTGVIHGARQGGFTVEIENVRAFLPGSLVDVRQVRDTSFWKASRSSSRSSSSIRSANNVVGVAPRRVEQEFSAGAQRAHGEPAGRPVVARHRQESHRLRAFVDLAGSTACCTSPTWRGSASSILPKSSMVGDESRCAFSVRPERSRVTWGSSSWAPIRGRTSRAAIRRARAVR